jgi:hypothetical protein
MVHRNATSTDPPKSVEPKLIARHGPVPARNVRRVQLLKLTELDADEVYLLATEAHARFDWQLVESRYLVAVQLRAQDTLTELINNRDRHDQPTPALAQLLVRVGLVLDEDSNGVH